MNKWKKQMFWLEVKLIPRRLLCYVTLHHRYEDPDPVITDGPINLPPCERDWVVLAFHRQCSLCYKIKSQGYIFTDAVNAVREAIEEDE